MGPDALREGGVLLRLSPERGVPLAARPCETGHTGGRAGTWGRGIRVAAAGASAQQESQRQLALAEDHERAAHEARQTASRYGIAAVTEKSVAKRLAPLTAVGYHLLPDRGWPGSRRAQVDLVVVGPAGLFIVDTKAWKDVTIAGGHIFRDQEDVTGDLDSLADLGYSTESVMVEIGLAPGEVHSVVVLAGRKGISTAVGTVEVVGELDVLQHIARRGQRLTASQVDAVLSLALSHFPVLRAPAPVDATIIEPVLPAQPETIDLADLATDDEIGEAIMAGILAAPIEDWMSFLHPDQAKLVRRSFTGPSRIRGAAGTGKTVVGLHRAAYLARSRPGRVLVTTYVKSLPAVLSTLLHRMAPEVADRVDFVSAHAFARRLLVERGIRIDLDTKKVDAAFAAAWREVGLPGILGKLDQSTHYWKDEINHVIKGRGITSFEPYADLARTGRRRQLRIEQRRAVWELYVAYQQRLAGVHDFSDVVTLAEASLRIMPLEKYSSVIVDEAQDLSCSMIRMLHHLVGNEPDGLTLIGDGRQTIYPGGYTLAEAGISLAGRGVVMNTNYRNTAEILDFASTMIAGDEWTDIEGPSPLDAAPLVARTGPAPVVESFGSRHTHDAALVARIRDVTREVGTELADVAVLALDRYALAPLLVALSAAGIPTVDLDTYDGTSVAAVKVGTVKRAKGLEFKQVLLAGVSSGLLSGAAPTEAAALERHGLQRRELYVAMTRARDGLWVGALS
ncbi:MAG: nuclease [Rhodoglobus sp.]|nr:nuclease [Rhodoglobus sp.]